MSTFIGLLILAVGVPVMFWLLGRPMSPRRAAADGNDDDDDQQGDHDGHDEHAHGPLIAAVSKGDAGEVARVLDAGADKEARNCMEMNALGMAILRGDGDIVQLLLDNGFDANGAVMKDMPALVLAAGHRKTKLIPLLAKAGAAVEACHPQHGSALFASIMAGDEEGFQALLGAGVPVGLRNGGGATDLHVAAFNGQLEMMQELVRRGVSIHVRNFQGGTPLRAAAECGNGEAVRWLLDAGADPSVVDIFDKRAIDYAREQRHAEVIDILEHALPPKPTPDPVIVNPLASSLPPRHDATLNSVLRVRDEGIEMARAACTSLEAPTLLAAIARVMPDFELTFPVRDEPDPRLPIRPVEVRLWRWHDVDELHHEPEPALEPPPDEVAAAVGAIARMPYLLRIWSEAARRVALPAPEVAAVMVHPPEAPEYLEPWDWWFRVQVAAALVLSHTSEGRNALKDIADGPADWSNTAAILALYDLARRDETARPSIIEKLLEITRRTVHAPAYQHAIQPAAYALLELGVAGDELTAIAFPED
jgi:ankyrin repeat protein